MNTDLIKKQLIMKNIFFKLVNNAVFGKATENMKKNQKY